MTRPAGRRTKPKLAGKSVPRGRTKREMHTEEALRASELRYRDIFALAEVGIAVADADDRLISANPIFCKTLGYSADELLRLHTMDFVHADDREESRRLTRINDEINSPVHQGERRYVRKDGSIIWVSVTSRWVLLGTGPERYSIGIIRDITDRIQAQDALRASEERYREIFACANVGIALADVDDRLISVNPVFCNMLGYSADELLRLHTMDVVHPDDLEESLRLTQANRENKTFVHTAERRYVRKDGSIIWVNVSARSVQDHTGAEKYSIGIVKDVTDNKRAETVMAEQARNLSTLISALPGVVYRSRLDEVFTKEFISDGIRELTGYPASDYLQTPWQVPALVHPDDRERVTAEIQAAMREKRPYENTFRIVTATGEEKWVCDKGQGVRDASGEVRALEGLIIDTTAHTCMEEALRESHERLRAILDAEPACVKLLNRDGLVLEMNRGGLEMFQADSLEQVRGQSMHLLVAPEYRRAFQNLKLRALEGSPGTLEFEIIGLKGAHRWLDTHVVPLRDKTGSVAGLVGVTRDISEQKASGGRIQAAMEQLRALTGRLHAVREEERTRIAREIHDVLAQDLTRLKIDLAILTKRLGRPWDESMRMSLLAKLSDLMGQVDSSIGTVQKIATELRPVVLDSLGLPAAIEWQMEDFEKRTGIRCRCSLSADHPPVDRDQATALFRILQESLTNVLRHAQATQVNVALEMESDEAILTVRDNGAGIAPLTHSDPRALGLIGMRERAMALGGSLEISGGPGSGTEISVRIPLLHFPAHERA